MAETKYIDWLVAGTSDIVKKRVLPALLSAPGSRVVGICGGVERARALAQEHGIAGAYGSLEEALEKCGARAVYVATPVDRHRPEAVKALQAGKHVLIEKPLGLNGVDAQAIVEAAKASGTVAGCAYYRRFFPRYELARKMIREGAFGKVTLMRIHVSGWFNPETTDPKIWRTIPSRAGGGNSMDMGSHMLDLLIHLVGMPVSVQAQVGTLVHGYEVDDSAAVLMRLADGAPVLADFHWNTKAGAHQFELVGTEARLTMSPADTGPVVKAVGRDIQTLDLPNAANVHQPLVDDFINAIKQEREPAIPVHEAQLVNRLLDAIYVAGSTGRAQRP